MQQNLTPIALRASLRLLVLIAIVCSVYSPAMAQTAAGTTIQNQASASYGDGSGGTYNTVSNTVTVTVAQVSGLTITPDAGTTASNVVPGQTGVSFSFRVTNTGNFTDKVRFLAGGASVTSTGPGTVTAAWVDVNSNGTYEAGTDVDIRGNASDAFSPNLLQNGFVDVVVLVNVSAAATGGNVINVRLGDAATGGPSFDNQAADLSANEVRTFTTGSVNNLREARGDRSATVDNDAALALALTAPAGPVPLGSVIAYNWQLCNTGIRAATSVTLTNGPAGSNTGVFIIAPIPAGTQLDATQTFPGGVGVLYSTSPLSSNAITAATWTTSLPALSTITRVAFNLGSSLAGGGTCGTAINMNVLITTSDATNPILEQGDAYAKNTISTQITNQSPQRQTLLLAVGSVLNGPVSQPGAVGPTNNNDDYTNKSVNTGIANVAPGGATTALGTVTFTNTVQNSGNANDSYTLTVPTFPAGSTVKVTVNAVQTTVVNAGAATGTAIPALSIAFGATANYTVDVTLPAGKTVLTGYDTVIKATSGNTSSASNDTIDRLYTGFVRLDKTSSVINGTGVGAATDAVPGAVITFSITYTNVSSTGGSNNVTLTANNIVITENGSTAPNNWTTYTTHVVGAADTLGGTITGDTAGSNLLTDTIATLSGGQSGIFTFKRQIN